MAANPSNSLRLVVSLEIIFFLSFEILTGTNNLYLSLLHILLVYHNHISSPQQAFSVFFVCVAFTSDIICLLFIPVQWLFFAASTYVWVQYVWHTGKAIQCIGVFIFC